MNNTAFYVILIVLILGIAYVMYTSETPPQTGMTQTPKEYIEQLEQDKTELGRQDLPDAALRESARRMEPSQSVPTDQP
jgi:hypothetical protein